MNSVNSINSERLIMNGTVSASSQVIDSDDVEMADGKGDGVGVSVKNGNSQNMCMNGNLHECNMEDMGKCSKYV